MRLIKPCDRHLVNPARISHQCVGCELEWLHEAVEVRSEEIRSLREEIDRLRVLYEQERKSSDTWKRYAETLADREKHWVSVGDELPGKGEVFVYLGGPSTKPGRVIAYHFGDGYFVLDDYHNTRVEVTHWMPLPAEPEGDSE